MNGDALLFFDGKPEELALYEALEARIFSEIENVRLKVSKSQISFYNRHLFAICSPASPSCGQSARPNFPRTISSSPWGWTGRWIPPGRRWSPSPTRTAGPITSSSPARRR